MLNIKNHLSASKGAILLDLEQKHYVQVYLFHFT